MAELLQYHDVAICYDDAQIVKNISFSLCSGEILGIVGESGSGKSTLVKAALGLLGKSGVVTRGDIFFHGKNLTDLSSSQLRQIRGAKIGMIFQDPGAALCPVRTIGAQIYEERRAHHRISRKESDAYAIDLFQKIGLSDGERILSSYSFELSGGMNQRVGIALAMLPGPEILLADEPTSALDVSVQMQVVEEMLLMRKLYGTSIIIVTHDIGVVRAMADNVLILKDGEMVEYGSKEQVLNRPQAAYTRELLGAVPVLKRNIA
ncbi:MAG: ABC transporter ATP-binding protein [Eubacteriales bacterium]|nr:ABC transporter ATP-binding protein [Eubacteriales bacterium]